MRPSVRTGVSPWPRLRRSGGKTREKPDRPIVLVVAVLVLVLVLVVVVVVVGGVVGGVGVGVGVGGGLNDPTIPCFGAAMS
jgi:hypothetical protein